MMWRVAAGFGHVHCVSELVRGFRPTSEAVPAWSARLLAPMSKRSDSIIDTVRRRNLLRDADKLQLAEWL